MLYTTTRNNTDTFTAHRTLSSGRGPDGGLFVPYRIPVFSREELDRLAGKGFNTNLAETLNLFFGCGLTGYDIELALGRRCVRLQQLGQKIIMAQTWHNTDWCFDRCLQDLCGLVMKDAQQVTAPTGWAGVAVRTAVLVGIFGELIREGLTNQDKKTDLCMVSGDFTAPMACWYARKMGLPIGNIICCCNKNAALWDFMCHGQLRTDGVAAPTMVPQADVAVPDGLERLICAFGGPEEAIFFAEKLRRGDTYYAEDSLLQRMRQGIYVTVSSEKRIRETIPSAFSTHGYLLTPADALCYAGLQDYRARTGEMPTALIMTEVSPHLHGAVIAEHLGISGDALQEYLNK